MSVKFNFYGISAHAGQSPELGRSAQDAVELMNVGANYLREHIIDSARVHYAITKTSAQPNTVPDYAQVWYYVRGPHRGVAEDVFKRVTNIARGAALMTDTKMEVEYVVGTPEPLPNDVMCNLLHESMASLPEIDWTKEDVAFAREIIKTLNQDAYKETLSTYQITNDDDKYLHRQLLPLRNDHPHLPNGSTDVSDASWIAPTGQIYTACGPLGTPLHSWQFTSLSGMSIGHKGMLYAAKAMAVAGIKLMESPMLVKAAKDEFIEKTGGKKFVSMIPKEVGISFDQ
jgi:aminobenzoyl-glutamate utilization protein B